jgi:hypothetical protein
MQAYGVVNHGTYYGNAAGLTNMPLGGTNSSGRFYWDAANSRLTLWNAADDAGGGIMFGGLDGSGNGRTNLAVGNNGTVGVRTNAPKATLHVHGGAIMERGQTNRMNLSLLSAEGGGVDFVYSNYNLTMRDMRTPTVTSPWVYDAVTFTHTFSSNVNGKYNGDGSGLTNITQLSFGPYALEPNITNDQSATFQAACDYAATNGSPVRVPPGHFMVNVTLTNGNVVIVGQGVEKTYLHQFDTNKPVLWLATSNHYEISHLSLIGNNRCGTGIQLSVTNLDAVYDQVRWTELHNLRLSGFQTAIESYGLSYSRLRDLSITDCEQGLKLTSLFGVPAPEYPSAWPLSWHTMNVFENLAIMDGETGIYLGGSFNVDNEFRGCAITGLSGPAFVMENTCTNRTCPWNNNRLVGCFIEYCNTNTVGTANVGYDVFVPGISNSIAALPDHVSLGIYDTWIQTAESSSNIAIRLEADGYYSVSGNTILKYYGAADISVGSYSNIFLSTDVASNKVVLENYSTRVNAEFTHGIKEIDGTLHITQTTNSDAGPALRVWSPSVPGRTNGVLEVLSDSWIYPEIWAKNGDSGRLWLGQNTNYQGRIQYSPGDRLVFWQTSKSDSNYIVFVQRNTFGDLVTNLVMTGAGKVGVGTNNPQSKLHVNGNLLVENGTITGNGLGLTNLVTEVRTNIAYASGFTIAANLDARIAMTNDASGDFTLTISELADLGCVTLDLNADGSNRKVSVIAPAGLALTVCTNALTVDGTNVLVAANTGAEVVLKRAGTKLRMGGIKFQ